MVLPGDRRAAPASALFVARLVYAFNWYNVGAVLPLIGRTFSASPATLGVVLGAFLVGVGLFQLPAGVAAVRYGSRRVSLFGLTLLGATGVAAAFSPTWEWLALWRFFGGVGAACFFSPALSLIASYYPAGQRGPIIGLYNGGFSVGGAVGLIGGAALGQWFGWPAALLFGGGALLATTALAWAILPRIDVGKHVSPGAVWATTRGVLRSRSVWALSIALTGFWAAIYIVAQYFVKFAYDVHPGWGLATSAGLATLVVVISFPGGPVGGWVGERRSDRRVLLAGFATLAGACVLVIPFAPLLALWPLFGLLGFVDGVVFAILYLVPSYLPETQGEGLALGVGVVNSIQVLLGSALAIAFGVVVALRGYTAAWEFAGVLSLALLPLLLFVQRTPAGPVRESPGFVRRGPRPR